MPTACTVELFVAVSSSTLSDPELKLVFRLFHPMHVARFLGKSSAVKISWTTARTAGNVRPAAPRRIRSRWMWRAPRRRTYCAASRERGPPNDQAPSGSVVDTCSSIAGARAPRARRGLRRPSRIVSRSALRLLLAQQPTSGASWPCRHAWAGVTRIAANRARRRGCIPLRHEMDCHAAAGRPRATALTATARDPWIKRGRVRGRPRPSWVAA